MFPNVELLLESLNGNNNNGDKPCLRILRMKVIGTKVLVSLIGKHADCREWINNWRADVEGAVWRTPQDIRDRYATASFLAKNVVIFNVRGNRYRLETQIAYQTGIVAVKWAGTHSEYTRRQR